MIELFRGCGERVKSKPTKARKSDTLQTRLPVTLIMLADSFFHMCEMYFLSGLSILHLHLFNNATTFENSVFGQRFHIVNIS